MASWRGVKLEEDFVGAGRLEILADGRRGGRAALNASAAVESYAGAELRPILDKEVREASPPFVLGKCNY